MPRIQEKGIDLPPVTLISSSFASAPSIITNGTFIAILLIRLRLIPVEFALRAILLKEFRNRLIVLDEDLADVRGNVFIALVVERCGQAMVANPGSTSYDMRLLMERFCS